MNLEDTKLSEMEPVTKGHCVTLIILNTRVVNPRDRRWNGSYQGLGRGDGELMFRFGEVLWMYGGDTAQQCEGTECY